MNMYALSFSLYTNTKINTLFIYIHTNTRVWVLGIHIKTVYLTYTINVVVLLLKYDTYNAHTHIRTFFMHMFVCICVSVMSLSTGM